MGCLPRQERPMFIRFVAVGTRQGVGYRLCVVIGALVYARAGKRV